MNAGGPWAVIAAGSRRAPVATTDAHFGNTLRNLHQTFYAESAPRKRPRIDARQPRPLPRMTMATGLSVRRRSRGRSSRPRNRRTSDSAHNDRVRPPLIAAVVQSVPVCRVPSSRNPTHSAEPQQIPARMESRPASRQCAMPVSTWNPSHRGSSQNHKAKNAVPTASEASAVGQGLSWGTEGEFPECGWLIGPAVAHLNLKMYTYLLFPAARVHPVSCAAHGGTSNARLDLRRRRIDVSWNGA